MGKPEKEIQDACMDYLGRHPFVAWVHVTTTGKMPIRGGKWVKLGYPGMGDIIGQLKNGRLLSVETKQPGQKPTAIQTDFMNHVNYHGGVALWCDSLDGLIEQFEGFGFPII